MSYTVTLIPAMASARSFRGHAPRSRSDRRRYRMEVHEAGEAAIAKYGTPLPDHILDSTSQ
jgi:hypothetical protein